MRNVLSHMSLTADTARRFYQHLQGEERSVTAYATINNKSSLEEGEEELTIYRVWEHKTSAQFGSAHLVVLAAIHDLIEGCGKTQTISAA